MTKITYLSTFLVLYSAPESYSGSLVTGYYESAATDFTWTQDKVWSYAVATNG